MEIVRKKLDPEEVYSSSLRYDADCACVQATNNGTDWVDAPERDPRSSPAFAVPPVNTGDATQCDAAASFIGNFRSGLTGTLQTINNGADAIGAASFIITILDFLDGIGLFIQFFIDLATIIIAAGTDVVSSAFTDEVYQQLTCIFQCAFQPDGTMTVAGFDLALAEVATTFGEFSTVNLVFNSWCAPIGNTGCQNIAALKHVTGDCSSCDPCTWSMTWDLTTAAHTFGVTTGCYGTWVLGQGFPNNSPNCGGYYRSVTGLRVPASSGCTIKHLHLEWTGHQTYGRILGVTNDDGSGFQGYQDYSNTPGTSPIDVDIDFTVSGGFFRFQAVLDDPSSDVCAQALITISGIGIEPSFPP